MKLKGRERARWRTPSVVVGGGWWFPAELDLSQLQAGVELGESCALIAAAGTRSHVVRGPGTMLC